MRLTEQEMKEDDERWADRDIIAELQFCGRNVRSYNQTTKMDVRFNAWVCRRVLKLIAGICAINSEAGEWRMVYHNDSHTLGHIECSRCKYRTRLMEKPNFCPNCGSYNGENIEQPDKKEE